MAFGGRELRLVLSIQSYGTTNIQRLRRDIMALNNASRVANQNQLAVQGDIARQAERAAASQARISSLQRQALAAQGIGPLRQRLKLEKALSAMGYRGAVLQDLLAGKAKARSVQAQAMVDTLRAQDMQLRGILSRLGIEKVKIGEILAEQKLLNGAVLAEAKARDAVIARAQALQDVELKGRQIAHIGRTAQFAGLIATAGFSLAAGSFADFTERASLAATQMRDIGAPIAQAVARSKELQDVILDLGLRFPATATEMSEAAYDIFSSMNIVRNRVVDTAKGFELLEVANKAAVAGGVELKEATDAMITVLNNFDPALQHVGQTMNEVFAIIRFGRMRLSDFASAMGSLAPIAAALGIPLKEMGSAFATLTILMKDQGRASAGLARLFELLRLPAFAQGFEKMGVAVKNAATGQIRNLLHIFEDLLKIRPDLAASQASAVEFFVQVSKASGLTKAGREGTIQARRAFEELVTHLQLFRNIAHNVATNKKELDAAFEARLQDPGVQWQIFINQLRAFALIVGREVLPLFLRIGEKIGDFVTWFRELNPAVRSTVIQLAAMLAIFSLLGGTVVNVAGSFIALRANMALMAIASQEAAASGAIAAKQFSAAGIIVRSLAFTLLPVLLAQFMDLTDAIILSAGAWLLWKTRAIQSIAAVVAAIRLGMTAVKTAIRAALLSTGFGALVVAAGIAVELIMNHWNEFRAFWIATVTAIRATWQELMTKWLPGAAMYGVGLALKAFLPLNTFFAKLGSFIPGIGGILEKALQPADFLTDQGKKLMASGGEEFGAVFGIAYAKAMKDFRTKKKRDDNDLLKDVQDFTNKLTSAQFRKAWEDYANNIGAKTGDAARLAKAHINAIQEATENMARKIDQAVDNIGQTYERLRQETEQAFGGFAQGPVMQGFLGDIFTNLNNMLRQFGVQIPVPFDIIRQDFDQQMEYFKRWNADLEALAKRGAPFTLVEQLRQMGPEAGIAIAEGILNAPKKSFKKLARDWDQREKDIDKITQKHLERQLDYWNSFGKSAAWQFVNGVATSPAWAKLRPTFKKYVVDTFGSILRAEFKAEVVKAMNDAKADIVAGKQVTEKGAKPPPSAAKAARAAKEATKSIPINQLTMGQIQARLMSINRQQAQIQRTMRQRARMFPGRDVPGEAQRSDRLIRLQQQEDRLISARKNLLRAEQIVVRQQLVRARQRGQEKVTITYMGDTVTVNTGATVQDVIRALNRQSFKKRNKGQRT